VVANSSELDLNNTMGTFAWADTKCSTLAPYMCRIMREWPGCVRWWWCQLPSWPLTLPPVQAALCTDREVRSRAAVPGIFNYTTKTTNCTYQLNTNPMAFMDADMYCQDQGGHLVSYGGQLAQTGGRAA
jgi:hypothetical protein